MEPIDLKSAWLALEARMARSEQLQLDLVRERRLDRAKRSLRPLAIAQWIQLLLGVFLIVLGVACWTRNTDVAGLLVAGLAVHAFGLVTAIAAGVTLALAARIDPTMPVLVLQRRLATLLRVYGINAALCGAPWWIMWLLVVVAFAGLGDVRASSGTPAWISWSLAIGAVCLAATWLVAWRRRPRGGDAFDPDVAHDCADGANGIRRSQRLLAEIARFEAG